MVDQHIAPPAITQPEDARTTAQLVHDLSDQVSRLVRDEIQLAGAELQRKGKRVGVGAGLFGGAGVVAMYGGVAAVATVILALSLAVSPWLAALIVTVALFALAGILALAGKKQIQRGVPPIPEDAVSSVKRDVATVKERAHS